MTRRTLLFSANGGDTEDFYASHTPGQLVRQRSQTNVGQGIHANPTDGDAVHTQGVRLRIPVPVLDKIEVFRAGGEHVNLIFSRIDISRWYVQRITPRLCMMVPTF